MVTNLPIVHLRSRVHDPLTACSNLVLIIPSLTWHSKWYHDHIVLHVGSLTIHDHVMVQQHLKTGRLPSLSYSSSVIYGKISSDLWILFSACFILKSPVSLTFNSNGGPQGHHLPHLWGKADMTHWLVQGQLKCWTCKQFFLQTSKDDLKD